MTIQWSEKQSLSYIPAGKLVTFTALHQAAYTQYMQVIDSNGNPISFTKIDGGSATFPISGSGTTVGFLANGSGSFTMQEGMSIQFANSSSTVSSVSATNPNQFFINNTVYGGGVFYAIEDGGGDDYNDTSCAVQWYESVG